MKARKSLLAASAAFACAGAVTASVALPAASANTSRRAVLAGSIAPARDRAHAVGAVGRSSQVQFELVLKLRDAKQAAALVRAISTPGSASYRHYLSTAQWKARFSPTAAHVRAAARWLRSQGFSVGAVSPDRITISATGTAAQIEKAFHTSLREFRVAGHRVREATANLSIPASLTGVVAGALNVNQHVATPALNYPPPPPAFETAPPCGTYYGQKNTTLNPPFGQGYPNTVPDVVCGYVPPQFRGAYGVTPATTGRGVTVAVIDAYDSPTIASDATNYFNRHDPSNPFSNARYTSLDPERFTDLQLCAPSSWATEQAIDVEAVHGMAPNAHILYAGARNCIDGLFYAEQYVIDHHLANVITNSWADTGGDLLDDAATKTAYDDLFEMAASTGITVQFSSGDDGDNFYLLGVSVPNYPSDSPLVTSVGGTTLKIGALNQRTGELGWDTGRSFLCTSNLIDVVPGCTKNTVGTWLPAGPDGISGGYTSYYYGQPPYQAGVVPTQLSERNAPIFGPVPTRVDPDFSLDADPGTGFLIGLTQQFNSGAHYSETRYGGTSLASPLLAGMVADADQAAGTPLGFINPTLYSLSGTPAIYDVLPPSSPEGMYRVDHADMLFGPGVSGTAQTFRELYYQGLETYCDATGNCASRQEPLTTAPGYDGLTGLGSPGTGFIGALAAAGSSSGG